MKRVRYSKYVPDPASDMSMEDLLSALSDYFLQSGFNDNFWYELPEGEKTLDELKRALEQALLNSEMFDEEMRDRLQQMQMEGELEELIEKLIERMQQEDYISINRTIPPSNRAWVDRSATRGSRRSSRLPTRASTFWDSRRCAICWGRWASRALDVMTRATWRPASRRAALRSSMSLATR